MFPACQSGRVACRPSPAPACDRSASLKRSRVGRLTCVVPAALFAVLLAAGPAASPLAAQEPVKVWEFSPYQVEIRYAFDSSITASQVAREHWVDELQAALERTFQAAWEVHLHPMSAELQRVVVRDFEGFTLEAVRAHELVLMVADEHPDAQAVRTFEAALEQLPEIACTADSKQQLMAAAEPWRTAEAQSPSRGADASDEPAGPSQAESLEQLISKCSVVDLDQAAIQQQLRDGSRAAALLPRWSLAADEASRLRPLPTPLPWQTDLQLRGLDKLIFVVVRSAGPGLVVEARELDCPMQFLGPAVRDSASHWSFASRLAGDTIARAFAPVARVEDAESKTAQLRLRAGGLILDQQQPAAVHVGDVLQPIIRRDDRNGVPTLLQPLPWTFAAITASDGIQMQANVYTYSGGPGLQGGKNRRTQRVLLRVRPTGQETALQLVIRGSQQPQAGCFVYRRDLLNDAFELLGRTDWRGQLSVRAEGRPPGILPEAERYQRLLAFREAEARAARAAASDNADSSTSQQATSEEATGEQPADGPAEGAAGEEAAGEEALQAAPPAAWPPTADDPAVIPLRAPLQLIYIKNGDTVLAKLPFVPGLAALQTAELPDDNRRLKAEGFVRGFQTEILDLVGLRNLLAARLRQQVKQGQIDAAKATLEELRRLKNYPELADELEAIQRRMLDENAGPVPLAAKNRIDQMFQTTRNMLQKFLQDDLLRDSERLVSGQ